MSSLEKVRTSDMLTGEHSGLCKPRPGKKCFRNLEVSGNQVDTPLASRLVLTHRCEVLSWVFPPKALEEEWRRANCREGAAKTLLGHISETKPESQSKTNAQLLHKCGQ